MADNDSLETADLFEVLSSDRRRALICFLRSQGGTADLRELAGAIAAWEQGIDLGAVSDDDKKRVYISLYQSHLPKLEEHGLVTYDADSKQVSATDEADHVIALFTQKTVRWDLYYLFVSALGFAILGLHLLSVIVIPVLPFTVAVICILLGLSLIHYYRHRFVIEDVLSEFSA